MSPWAGAWVEWLGTHQVWSKFCRAGWTQSRMSVSASVCVWEPVCVCALHTCECKKRMYMVACAFECVIMSVNACLCIWVCDHEWVHVCEHMSMCEYLICVLMWMSIYELHEPVCEHVSMWIIMSGEPVWMCECVQACEHVNVWVCVWALCKPM